MIKDIIALIVIIFLACVLSVYSIVRSAIEDRFKVKEVNKDE